MNQPGQHAHEPLSAAIDGELSREELRFLLRRLDHDDELQLRWTSYHLARDGLRRELPALASRDFASRVSLAIEQESVVVVVAAPASRHRWLRWSAGGAIAAGVAAVALMVAQPAGNTGRHSAPLTAQAEPGMAVPNNASTMVAAAAPAEVAVVPQWLSGKAPGLLSQRASATLGAPSTTFNGDLSLFPDQRYRTRDNHDGSYLILLDPARQPVPDMPRQGAVRAR